MKATLMSLMALVLLAACAHKYQSARSISSEDEFKKEEQKTRFKNVEPRGMR